MRQTHILWLICVTCVLTAPLPADELSREQKLADRYLQLLKRSPKEGTAFDRVFDFHQSAGSLSTLTDALSADAATETDGAAHFVRGLIERRRGNLQQADEALREAAAVRPDDATLMLYRGQVATARNDRTAAIDHFENALQTGLAAAFEERVFLALGRLYQQTGQVSKATEVWQRYEKAFPDDPLVLQQIAEALAESGQAEQALQRYEKLMTTSRDPEQRMQFLLAAADLKRTLNRATEAREDLAKALESVRPSSWLYGEIQQRVEEIYLSADDSPGLIAWYESRLQRNPTDIPTTMRLARALDSDGKTTAAIARLQAAVPAAPTEDTLGRLLIDLLEQNNQIAAAIQQCERLHDALTAAGRETSDLLEHWGRLCLRSEKSLPQRQADALNVWQNMAAGTNDVAVILRVADLLSEAGILQAEDYYRRAVDRDGGSLPALESLGAWLHAKGRETEATAVWEQIAAAPMDTAERVRRLGEIYANFGLTEQRRTTLQRLQQMSPQFRDIVALARITAESGDPIQAEVLLRQAADLAASDAERRSVLDLLVSTARESGQLTARIFTLKNQVASKSAWDLTLLALLLAEGGRDGEALTTIRPAVALQPSSVLYQSVAADLQEKSGSWKQAIATRTALARLDQREASLHLRKVVELHRRLGQFDQAIIAGEALLEAAPANVASYQFVADMCVDLSREDQAGEILRRCVRVNPGSVAALQAMGEYLGRRFRTAAAMQAYWSALELTTDPERRRGILTALAELAARSGQFSELQTQLRRWAAQLSPNEAAQNLAIALRAGGRLPEARKLLLAEHRKSPRDVAILKLLVQLAEDEDDFATAVTFQQQLFAVTRTQDAENRLGSLIVRAAESSADLATWLRESRVDLPATVMLQQVDRLLQENRLAECRAFCRRLLSQSPDNWEALYRMAVIAAREQQFAECRLLCRQVMSLEIPGSTPAGLSAGAAPPTSLDLLSGMSDRSQAAVQRRVEWLLKYPQADDPPEALKGRVPEFRSYQACRLHSSLLWWHCCQTKSEREELLGLLQPETRTGALDWSWWLLMYRHVSSRIVAERVDSFLQQTEQLLDPKIPETQAAFLVTISLRNGLTEQPAALPEVTLARYQQAVRSLADILPVGTLEAYDIRRELLRSGTTTLLVFLQQLQTETASVPSRELAVRLATSDDETYLTQLKDLTTAWQQSGTTPTEGSMLRLLGGTLYPKVLQELRSNNVAAATRIVEAYFQLRSRLPQLGDSATAGQSQDSTEVFERRNIVIKSQPGLFQQRRLVRAGGVLTRDDHAFLVNLLEIYPEAEQPALQRLLAETIQNSDAEGRVVLELMAAELASLQGDVESAIVHIIRAAAAGPDNVPLRVSLAAWYGAQGNQADALTLLDTIEADQQVLLQQRELMALDFAAVTGATERVKTAAERLYGQRLSGRQADDLSRRMRELGLSAEADALRDRQRSGQRDTLRDKVRLMESEPQDVAVEIAIEILRQTDSDVVSWTSDISSDKARQAAVSVLGAAGRLGDLIRTAELRRQQSPDSVRLHEELLSYYTASDQLQKADAIRERLKVLAPETVDSMMQEAADFERRRENISAADRYLQVFRRDPIRFAQDYFRYLRLFEEADRLPQIAELMLQPETLKRLQNHHHVVMETVQFLFAASTKADEDQTREKGLLLFRAAWQQFPNYRRSIVSNIHTDAMWELPELVEYAREGLIPQSMQQAIARPWQGLAEKLDHAQDGSVRGTLSRIRASLQQDRALATTYVNRVKQALQDYPNWHGGRVLLAVLLLDQDQPEQVRRQLEQIAADKDALFMPVHVAWLLSQEILRSQARQLDDISIELFQRVLKTEPPFPSGVAASASLWLARYHHQRGEHSLAVAAVNNSIDRITSSDAVQRATIILDASQALRGLGYEFDALRLAEKINASLFADPTDKPARQLLDRARNLRNTDRTLTAQAAAIYLQMSVSRADDDLFLEVRSAGRQSGQLRSLVLETLQNDRTRRIRKVDLLGDMNVNRVPPHVATAAVVLGQSRQDRELLQAGAAALDQLTKTETALPHVAWLAAQALRETPDYADLAGQIQASVLQSAPDGREWIHAAVLTQAARVAAAAGDVVSSQQAWNDALDLLLAENTGGDDSDRSDVSRQALQELRDLLLQPPGSQ